MKNEEHNECSEHTGVHQQPPPHPAIQCQERGKRHNHSHDDHENEKNDECLGEHSRGRLESKTGMNELGVKESGNKLARQNDIISD